MDSGGRRDTTGSIWCRACTQDCLLFISFALGHFTYWGQNGFEIAYTSTLKLKERSSKNDHGTFQFLPHMMWISWNQSHGLGKLGHQGVGLYRTSLSGPEVRQILKVRTHQKPDVLFPGRWTFITWKNGKKIQKKSKKKI